MAEEFLVVGQVVAAQGLKGEVRILPASDFPQRFTEPGTRWLRRRGQGEQEVQLLSGRQLPGKELFVVRFEGCLLYTSPSPRDKRQSRMPSSA